MTNFSTLPHTNTSLYLVFLIIHTKTSFYSVSYFAHTPHFMWFSFSLTNTSFYLVSFLTQTNTYHSIWFPFSNPRLTRHYIHLQDLLMPFSFHFPYIGTNSKTLHSCARLPHSIPLPFLSPLAHSLTRFTSFSSSSIFLTPGLTHYISLTLVTSFYLFAISLASRLT